MCLAAHLVAQLRYVLASHQLAANSWGKLHKPYTNANKDPMAREILFHLTQEPYPEISSHAENAYVLLLLIGLFQVSFIDGPGI